MNEWRYYAPPSFPVFPVCHRITRHSLSDEVLCFEKCFQFQFYFRKINECLIWPVWNIQKQQKMLGWKRQERRESGSMVGPPTAWQVLFFLSVTEKNRTCRPGSLVTSDLRQSFSSQEEPIGKKNFERRKEHGEKDVLLSAWMVIYCLVN